MVILSTIWGVEVVVLAATLVEVCSAPMRDPDAGRSKKGKAYAVF
jgi:hypothetical protein